MMDEVDREGMSAEFDGILRATGRNGMEGVLDGLRRLGFHEAPASSAFHCAYPGGLLEHSLNVYRQMAGLCRMERELHGVHVPDDTIAITALLHDVCKAEVYRRVEKFRKDRDGRWERYMAYSPDHSRMPLGHGEKSVIRLLRMGLELREDEIIAIRWHMGAWDLSGYGDAKAGFNAACDRTPALPILMAADSLASRISERREEGCGNNPAAEDAKR